MNQPSRAGALDAFLDDLAERIAAKLEARQRCATVGMVEQAASPLGRRKHCAAVKRRVASGLPGAAIVGRRHLLSADALAEELGRASGQPRATTAPSAAAGSVRAELDRELRLLKGGGRG